MSLRFLADADLNHAIVTGARLREPAIDFLGAIEAGLEGISDPEALGLAASRGCQIVARLEF